MFTVNQVNSLQNKSENDLEIMRSIYRLMAPSFQSVLSTDDFVALEMEHYEDKSAYTQFFYLTAENGDIACVHEVFPRKGYHEETVNLLITMVYTNVNYRGRGIIGKLINWVINYYENSDLGDETELKLCDSIKNGLSSEYLDFVLPKNLRNSNDVHWSLYSIVDTFYMKFGFTPCYDMKWLETDLSEVHVKDFTLNEHEKLLSAAEATDLLKQDKYWFEKTTSKDVHNCSFEETSIPGFIARYQAYINLNKAALGEKAKVGDVFGFHINDGSNETLVTFSPFFFMERVVVSRVYTDATDPEVFAAHWKRAVEFIYTYAQNIWATLPSVPVKDNIIMVGKNDFVSKSGSITPEKFVDIVTSIDSWKDVDTGMVLPHIKDWKQHKPLTSKIAHNGFWSFM